MWPMAVGDFVPASGENVHGLLQQTQMERVLLGSGAEDLNGRSLLAQVRQPRSDGEAKQFRGFA